MSVTWKSKSWGQEYRIFRDKIIVGLLKKETWKRKAYGEYNGTMLRFVPKGLWSTRTLIFDIEGNNQLGIIEYSNWNAIGKVTFREQVFEWKYDSIWKRNKWTITDGTDFANYTVTSIWKGEGEIEIEGAPAALVLTGLFIHNYFESRRRL